jgi:CcmD family protein
MERTTYLVLAYMIIWAGVAGYLLWLSGRQRQTARRLEELTNRIKQQEARS